MPTRYAFLALALLLPLAAPRAQAPIDLAYRGGGTGSDIGQKVAVWRDGTTAVVGDFEGVAQFGSVTLTSADNPAARSDVFVAVYSREGVVQWGRRMGTGVFNDFAGDVTFDDMGNVYVSGYFTGVATFDGGSNPTLTLTTRSDFDVFLAKYSPTGALLWVRQSGGTEQDTGRGIAVGGYPDVAVYQTGGFTGTATWGEAATGDTTITAMGGSDAFVASYTLDGVLRWVRTVAGSNSDTAYDVDISPDNEGPLVLLGQFNGVARVSPTLALSSRGLSDVFVAAYDGTGTAQWAQQIGGAGNEYGRGIALDALGSFAYAGGSFDDDVLIGNDILQTAGFSDIYLAQLNMTTGALVWGRRGGGTGFDFVDDVVAQPRYAIPTAAPAPALSPVYLVGYVDGSGDFPSPGGTGTVTTNGGVDGVLVGYSGDSFGATSGDLLGVYPLGGTSSDRAAGVAIVPPALDVLVTGPFRGAVTFGATALTSAGSNDMYVARVLACPTFFCYPTSTEAGAEAALALAAPAPNPATGQTQLALHLDRARTARVEVLDALGRRVLLLHDGALAAGRHTWTLSTVGLAPGAYVIRAEAEGLHELLRLAVVR